MRFLAGLYDAEGTCSLTPGGYSVIHFGICDEYIPYLFQERFDGSVNRRIRDKLRDFMLWNCPKQNHKRFITEIEKFSITKRTQLILLQEYLSLDRKTRRENRKNFVHLISQAKKPLQVERDIINVPTNKVPDENFFEWFAGFMEGDGSFCAWESKTLNTKKPSFSISIEACNCQPETIQYIKSHIEGYIGMNKQNKNIVWKWICHNEQYMHVLSRLFPYLISKKKQCSLLMEFRTIMMSRKRRPLGRGLGKGTKGGWNNPDFLYTQEEVSRLRAIICEIKTLHRTSFKSPSALMQPLGSLVN